MLDHGSLLCASVPLPLEVVVPMDHLPVLSLGAASVLPFLLPLQVVVPMDHLPVLSIWPTFGPCPWLLVCRSVL